MKRFGTRVSKSLIVKGCILSNAVVLKADTAEGTSCRLSEIRLVVTTNSSTSSSSAPKTNPVNPRFAKARTI